MSISLLDNVKFGLTASELELLQEIVQALRSMRFGSVLLTVHDGRLVEIHKTEKIRTSGSKLKD